MNIKTILTILFVLVVFAFQAQAGELHDAVRAGDIPKVRKLLKQGADVNEMFNRTPLHDAVRYKYFDIAIILLEKGAGVNLEDNEGNTPLSYIVFWGDDKKAIQLVQIIIKKGFNFQKPANSTLLSEAITRQRKEIAMIFLKNGIIFSDAALAAAARQGYEDIFNLLLEKGANPINTVTFSDACHAGNIGIVQSLAKRGVSPSAAEIDYCLYRGHKEAAVYLNNVMVAENKPTADIKKRCGLQPDPGPCMALLRHAYFDGAACRGFFYGGCGGIIPFYNLQACKNVCE